MIQLAVEQCKITHDSPMAIAASASLTAAIATALKGKKTSEIIEEAIVQAERFDKETAEAIKDATKRALKIYNDASELYPGNSKECNAYVIQEAKSIFSQYEGWNSRDAAAASLALFILSEISFAKQKKEFDTNTFCCKKNMGFNLLLEAGIKTPGDSDTILILAGALLGAKRSEEFKNDLVIQSLIPHIENVEILKKLAKEASYL